jgi:hypothetical protein
LSISEIAISKKEKIVAGKFLLDQLTVDGGIYRRTAA